MKIQSLFYELSGVINVGYFEIRKNEEVLYFDSIDNAIVDYHCQNQMVYESSKKDIEEYKRNMKLLDYDFNYLRFESIETYEKGQLVRAKKVIIFLKRGVKVVKNSDTKTRQV